MFVCWLYLKALPMILFSNYIFQQVFYINYVIIKCCLFDILCSRKVDLIIL